LDLNKQTEYAKLLNQKYIQQYKTNVKFNIYPDNQKNRARLCNNIKSVLSSQTNVPNSVHNINKENQKTFVQPIKSTGVVTSLATEQKSNKQEPQNNITLPPIITKSIKPVDIDNPSENIVQKIK
jgi:hypothetical protein